MNKSEERSGAEGPSNTCGTPASDGNLTTSSNTVPLPPDTCVTSPTSLTTTAVSSNDKSPELTNIQPHVDKSSSNIAPPHAPPSQTITIHGSATGWCPSGNKSRVRRQDLHDSRKEHQPDKIYITNFPTPGRSADTINDNKRKRSPSPFDQRPLRRQRVSLGKQFTIASCPNTCPCKTRGRAPRVPSIERSLRVSGPLYKNVLDEIIKMAASQGLHRCCENYCSVRWSRKRAYTSDECLDDCWPHDVDVKRFRRRQWKIRKRPK